MKIQQTYGALKMFFMGKYGKITHQLLQFRDFNETYPLQPLFLGGFSSGGCLGLLNGPFVMGPG